MTELEQFLAFIDSHDEVQLCSLIPGSGWWPIDVKRRGYALLTEFLAQDHR